MCFINICSMNINHILSNRDFIYTLSTYLLNVSNLCRQIRYNHQFLMFKNYILLNKLSLELRILGLKNTYAKCYDKSFRKVIFWKYMWRLILPAEHRQEAFTDKEISGLTPTCITLHDTIRRELLNREDYRGIPDKRKNTSKTWRL